MSVNAWMYFWQLQLQAGAVRTERYVGLWGVVGSSVTPDWCRPFIGVGGMGIGFDGIYFLFRAFKLKA